MLTPTTPPLHPQCIYDGPSVATLRRIVAEGHQVASHSWSHPDLTLAAPSALALEISLVDTALQRILGLVPAFFRPPFGQSQWQRKHDGSLRKVCSCASPHLPGNINGAVTTALTAANKIITSWDSNSLDWEVEGLPSFATAVQGADRAEWQL